jgi:hypothetical protein
MKKIVLILSLVISMVLVSSCAVTTPAIGINLNYNGACYLMGKSSYSALFRIFFWGDGSITTAMNDAGIKRIHHVDVKTENYLIFQKVTYIVYGDDSLLVKSPVAHTDSTKTHTLSQEIMGADTTQIKVINVNGNYGYINRRTNQVIIPAIYEGLKEFSEGLAAAKRFGKWGFINEKGDMVIDFKFDKVGKFNDGAAFATYAGKNGYIDEKGSFYEK